MKLARGIATLGLAGVAACMSADDASGLGSVEFTVASTPGTSRRDQYTLTDDGWALRFDRVVLGFKTMTLDKHGMDDVCGFRGRGETSDVVFDPRNGIVQTFNGIEPSDCPDVGIIFGVPGPATSLAGGATTHDLADLVADPPAHAIVEVTAFESQPPPSPSAKSLRILMRFESVLTATQFGGCRTDTPGVRIAAARRERILVNFAPEYFFRRGAGTDRRLFVESFTNVARTPDRADVITMTELDVHRLSDDDKQRFRFAETPQLFRRVVTFGDYLRALFRNAVLFGNEEGACVGQAPSE
jgi:hypothetical protein